MLNSIIAGAFALGGVVIGNLFSYFQNKQRMKFEKNKELLLFREKMFVHENELLQYAIIINEMENERYENYKKFIEKKVVVDFYFTGNFGYPLNIRCFISTLNNMLVELINGNEENAGLKKQIKTNIEILRKYFNEINQAHIFKLNVVEVCKVLDCDETIQKFITETEKYIDNV